MVTPNVIRTKRLVLRALTHEDADDMFAYARDPEVSRYLSWSAHRTVADSHAFIAWAVSRYRQGAPAPWAVALDGTVIGTATFLDVHETHRFTSIGYVIGRSHWGNGYAPEITRALLEEAFERRGFNRVEAQVRSDNIRSAHVLKKAGLRFEADLRQRFFINNRFYDSKMYCLLAEQWRQTVRDAEAFRAVSRSETTREPAAPGSA
jgi:ribosomal-protein-alanine N-acetyltransferase